MITLDVPPSALVNQSEPELRHNPSPVPSAGYATIERDAAKLLGYKQLTASFGVRGEAQRIMLDHAIADLAGKDVVLVRVGGEVRGGLRYGGNITIWRKGT